MFNLCLAKMSSRSRYASGDTNYCQRHEGHDGKHDERPYLRDLMNTHDRVAEKIWRDSNYTTGAAWNSSDAGPNRIKRWAMLLDDDELLTHGLNMSALNPTVRAKLRDKAATYQQCMEVAKKLTWLVYQMTDAPTVSQTTKDYLESYFGPMIQDTTTCLVCLEPLSFGLFSNATRGRADIETAHRNPRQHNANNVGFAHRECNIAQGSKTLEEFYRWIIGIANRIKNYTS